MAGITKPFETYVVVVVAANVESLAEISRPQFSTCPYYKPLLAAERHPANYVHHAFLYTPTLFPRTSLYSVS